MGCIGSVEVKKEKKNHQSPVETIIATAFNVGVSEMQKLTFE